MRRRWNHLIWIGFGLALVAGLAFTTLAGALPGAADWIVLLGLLAGAGLIAAGLVRALRRPDVHRGRIAAPILLLLALAMTAIFTYGVFVEGRNLPGAAGAPRAGDPAPAFTLTDAEGRSVALADLLGGRGALIIFYRGHW